MPGIGLALHGGGFAGAKQIGLPEELWARNKIPSLIQGVSVGALNAAKLVESGPEGLKKAWLRRQKLGPSSVFNWAGAITHAWSGSLLSDYGLNELVREGEDGLVMSKIMASPIELQIAVRNETHDRIDIFSNRDEAVQKDPEILRKAIKASASLPGIFPPVEINGEWYSDGWHFDLSKMTDCEVIFVVINDESKIGKNFHQAKWYKRFFVGFSENLDDAVEAHIASFLENHPEFDKIKLDSKLGFVDRGVRKAITAAKKFLGISHQLVITTPEYKIPTLILDSFRMADKHYEGDIVQASRLSLEQAKKLLDELGF